MQHHEIQKQHLPTIQPTFVKLSHKRCIVVRLSLSFALVLFLFSCSMMNNMLLHNVCKAINKLVFKSISKSKCSKRYSNSKVIQNILFACFALSMPVTQVTQPLCRALLFFLFVFRVRARILCIKFCGSESMNRKYCSMSSHQI